MKNKSVYILTYSTTSNYGGLLQMFSLYSILSREFDVSIVHYKNKSKLRRSKVRSFASNIYRHIFKFLYFDKKRNRSETKFKALMKYTDCVCSIEELSKFTPYAFIVGSDQVWNPFLNGFDPSFLLMFDTCSLKISYSASFGLTVLPNKWIECLKNALKSFHKVSLREDSGIEILNIANYTGDYTIDLDPTLLLNETEWLDVLKIQESTIHDNYVLVYLMPGDKKIERSMLLFAKKIAKDKSLKMIVIGRKNIDKLKPSKVNFYHAGPVEFVKLINDAEFVITNSFHGTAFSVNFNKQFYSFINSETPKNESLYSRIDDLLDKIGLRKRIIDIAIPHNIPSNISIINFDAVNEKLNNLREISLKNLENSLK